MLPLHCSGLLRFSSVEGRACEILSDSIIMLVGHAWQSCMSHKSDFEAREVECLCVRCKL